MISISAMALGLVLNCQSVDRDLPYTELTLGPDTDTAERLDIHIHRLFSYVHYWAFDFDWEDAGDGTRRLTYPDGEAVVTPRPEGGWILELDHVEDGGWPYHDAMICRED